MPARAPTGTTLAGLRRAEDVIMSDAQTKPATTRERMMQARRAIAMERGIPEEEVHGWEAGFRAWGPAAEVTEEQGKVADD